MEININMSDIWKKLADDAKELIIICTKTGQIEYVNKIALELLDYTYDKITKMQIGDLFLEKKFDLESEMMRELKEPLCIEGYIYSSIKTCFQVALKIVQHTDEGKFVIYAEDMTELVKAQREVQFVSDKAQAASVAKDQFTANITHELRTPVNGIKGHTQYLMTTQIDNEQKKELSIISECCNNMEKLINNILDFEKLQSGKFTISNREFVFQDFINYISETNGKLIENKGLRFIVNVDPGIPNTIIGDDFRLTQVVNNLLSNALKFTQKGYIALEVNKSVQFGHDIELFFMVMDTGIGIPAEKKDELFESFTQADASTSRTYGGTGLGLAITKQIVELMNGHVELESEVGRGSSFSFTVSMQVPDSEVVNAEASAQPTQHITKMHNLFEQADLINEYGTIENTEEIDRNLEKLGLCIELENFEKTEAFAENIKNLVVNGPANLKPLAFKVVMMARKENVEKVRECYDELVKAIEETR